MFQIVTSSANENVQLNRPIQGNISLSSADFHFSGASASTLAQVSIPWLDVDNVTSGPTHSIAVPIDTTAGAGWVSKRFSDVVFDDVIVPQGFNVIVRDQAGDELPLCDKVVLTFGYTE